jgi:hypothetical protein
LQALCPGTGPIIGDLVDFPAGWASEANHERTWTREAIGLQTRSGYSYLCYWNKAIIRGQVRRSSG